MQLFITQILNGLQLSDHLKPGDQVKVVSE